jgi:hypothetical protein
MAKSNKELKDRLHPKLEAMVKPLDAALSGLESDNDKPFKLTVTLSNPDGKRTTASLCRCKNNQGTYDWETCPCKPR